MRRTTGAILIEIRPDMISRSAWRGDAGSASKPQRAQRLEAEARDVHPLIDDRHHLHRAAREPERGRHECIAACPVGGLLERRREHALFDVLVELGTFQLAVEHRAGGQLAGAELARLAAAEPLTGYFHSSAPLRHT